MENVDLADKLGDAGAVTRRCSWGTRWAVSRIGC